MKTFLEVLNVRKDLTVGDVHVSTALGNEEPPWKRKRPKVRAFVGAAPDDGLTEDDDTETDATVKRSLKSADIAEVPTWKRYASTKDLPDAVKGKIKGKKRRRQWMHVFNSALASHGDEGRAFASAWSAVKKSDVLSGDPMVGVGGRRLEPFDAGTYFVPLRYDPSALSRLTRDQLPRFLDAITHPDRLTTRDVAIKDLTVVQNRVSGETIEGQLDGMTKGDPTPPVVVYVNGSFLLADGHNRVTAMWLDGADVVTVAYADIAEEPEPVDATHRNTAYELLQGVNGRALTNYVDGSLAVPFMCDGAFLSHLRPDQVPKFLRAVTHPDELADATVNLATVVAIQDRVNADKVAAKVEKPSKKLPVIVRINEVNYIADGHDRLTAAWLRGADNVAVKLTDITWADNLMKPSDVVKATMAAEVKAQEKLEAAEGYVRYVADAADEAKSYATAKRAEADERVADAERVLAEKRAEADRIVADAELVLAEKRAEAEREATEALIAIETEKKRFKRKVEVADDHVEEMVRKSKQLDRYVADQQESIDRQVAKAQQDVEKAREDAERDVADAKRDIARVQKLAEQRLEEADRYFESAEKATRKVKKKAEWIRTEADRYAVDKRAEADQYDADRRTAADQYEITKKMETDQREFDRRRELGTYELSRMDEIHGRERTERLSKAAQELKKNLRSGASQLKVDIKKVNQDKMQVFGWASVLTRNGAPVIDKQGDIIPVEEMEPAVYEYMLSSRDGSDMHCVRGVSKCIESVFLSYEKQDAMGITPRLDIEAWWIGMQCLEPELWSRIKSGELAEFSIGGQAVSTRLED